MDISGNSLVDRARTTILFTEVLEHMRDKELYPVFKEHRDVDEVVIPPKRDKRGKKYDFVLFFNV